MQGADLEADKSRYDLTDLRHCPVTAHGAQELIPHKKQPSTPPSHCSSLSPQYTARFNCRFAPVVTTCTGEYYPLVLRLWSVPLLRCGTSLFKPLIYQATAVPMNRQPSPLQFPVPIPAAAPRSANRPQNAPGDSAYPYLQAGPAAGYAHSSQSGLLYVMPLVLMWCSRLSHDGF